MGYTVEVSFNIEKCCGFSEKSGNIFNYANSCQAISSYEDYEMSGNVKTPRRHCVISTMFGDDQASECAKFIKGISFDRQVYIESIYSDFGACNLIYASPHYISNMEKRTAKAYKEKRSNRTLSLSEGESIILQTITEIKDKYKKKNKKTKSLGENPSLPKAPYLSLGPSGLTGPST